MLTAGEISSLVRQQLDRITDSVLVNRIHKLLVTPYPVERDWDYGHVGERFTCWTVQEHPPSNTGVAYCEQGFGPADPWGLVFLSGEHMGIAWIPVGSQHWNRPCATAGVGWREYTKLQSSL